MSTTTYYREKEPNVTASIKSSTTTFHLRQSAEERAQLEKRAAEAGLAVSAYIRQALYLRYTVDDMGTAVRPTVKGRPKKVADR